MKLATLTIVLGLTVSKKLKTGEIRIVQFLIVGLVAGNLLSIYRGTPEIAREFNSAYIPVLTAMIGYFFGKEESEL